MIRTLNVAELLAQNDRHSQGLRRIIGEFQAAIDDEIFDHGQLIGQQEKRHIYTFLDKETGELIWNSYSDPILTQQQLAELSERAVLKELNWEVRDAEGTGLVYTHPRTKGLGEIVDKMIRDAQRREMTVGDNFVDPSCITDLGGIKHVLLDENSLDGETMNKFIERHRQLAIETFGPDTLVLERNETNGDIGQSTEHEFRRIDIIVTRNGKKYQIEMLFETLPLYLKNMFKFGSVDPRTGYRDGPAHPIYEITRKKDTARTFYPDSVFGEIDGEQVEIDWDSDIATGCENAVEKILSESTIPVEEWPELFTQIISFPNIELPTTETIYAKH